MAPKNECTRSYLVPSSREGYCIIQNGGSHDGKEVNPKGVADGVEYNVCDATTTSPFFLVPTDKVILDDNQMKAFAKFWGAVPGYSSVFFAVDQMSPGAVCFNVAQREQVKAKVDKLEKADVCREIFGDEKNKCEAVHDILKERVKDKPEKSFWSGVAEHLIGGAITVVAFFVVGPRIAPAHMMLMNPYQNSDDSEI